MAKAPSRTREPRKQPETLAPVLTLVPKPRKSVKRVVDATAALKRLADDGNLVGMAGIFIPADGGLPIVNTFGITYEQRYLVMGALMDLMHDLQDWEE